MKTIIISLFLIVFSIIVLLLIPSKQPPAPMPWEITLMPDGNSKVFGIHLGTTTFRQAQEILHAYGKTAIFIQKGEMPTIEAFFESIHLGGLSAKVVLNIPATEQQINNMLQRATEARLQPSGAHRYDLSQEDHASILNRPIITITYIPSIKLDKEKIEHRFGQPEYIETDPNESETQIWQYTSIGLIIRLNPNKKSILQYQSQP